MSTLDILAIDIDAALRKLTEKRFKSIDDPALVLVRYAAAQSPKGMRILFRNRTLRIETVGHRIDPSPFHHLRVLFDPTEPKSIRSQALNDLENSIGLDILAAFAGGPSRVSFSWKRDTGIEGIRFVPGERPKPFTSETAADMAIRIRGGIPVKADPEKVAEKCRFSEIPVFINGRRVSRGIKVEGSLIRHPLSEGGLRGVVGIPKEGDLTKIIFLDAGIISDELFMPAQGGLVFHATVYGRRGDFQSFYPHLRKAAKKLLPHLAKGYKTLSRNKQKLAEVRLFDRYEVTRQSGLVRGVKAFQSTDGDQLDLLKLREREQTGNIHVIDESAADRGYAVKNRLVIVVNRRQRRFLDAMLRTPLKTPPKRVAVNTKTDGLRQRLGRFFKAFKGAGNQIPDKRLTHEERRFLTLLLDTLSESGEMFVAVAMTDGNLFPPKKVYRDGIAFYLIPRNHPTVKKIMANVLENPAYTKPAVTLLCGAPVREAIEP